MKDEQNKQYFSTPDLHLAAALITSGFYMEGVDYQFEGLKPRPVGYFNFQACPEIDATRSKFRQGILPVDAKTLFGNMKSLLAEVNNAYKNPHADFVEK